MRKLDRWDGVLLGSGGMPKREFQSPGCDFGLGLRGLVLALRLSLGCGGFDA